MRIGWLLGWATPEAWFAPFAREALPDAEHVFVEPTSAAWSRLEAAAPLDWVAGYSLGSLLLLADAARANRLGRVALLAPIFAFPKDAGLGGRVARTQLRYLARWLQREPTAALVDFYARAGLVVPERMQPAASADDLLWGLEQLENLHARPPLPEGWLAWVGAEDALLDAERVREIEPAVRRVPGATHHPRALVRALAGAIR